jgi:dynein heavy chain
LELLAKLVNSQISDLHRRAIVSLITCEVHGRDILQSLAATGVESVWDFDWQRQLRYYWDTDERNESELGENCYVRQVNVQFTYGYEYQGATSRLVVTPLTEKCWITITQALQIKLGALASGPAGTGKTESVKDLAKALAIMCVVFNCSEQIDYRMTGRLISGLSQQGCWACLDEFNRIDIEVLSVVAQQMIRVRHALLDKRDSFEFEDNVIPLKHSVGLCVTQNPGYKGRTELPDNLKVLFRPAAMMMPEYKAISEVMLYSEGFMNAPVLAKKMVILYKLASEQLSQQKHYDFGMRALKSILQMAGQLRRASLKERKQASGGQGGILPPEVEASWEEELLITAMENSNLPKLLPDDIALFRGLLMDLFPYHEVGAGKTSVLTAILNDVYTDNKLLASEALTTKTLQLFETLRVRYGTMLLGNAASGKTVILKTLADALTRLKLLGLRKSSLTWTMSIWTF